MSIIHKKNLPEFNIETILEDLFQKAKSTDEFEYCCTLLRIRGSESAGWDTLVESNTLIQQLISLTNIPLVDHLKLRLYIMIYCHATEINDFYNIIGNMLRIIDGKRFSIDCFMPILHSSNKKAKYPESKIERINEWANKVGNNDIGVMLESMLVKEVRNAFFHSDYIITQESFNIRNGSGPNIENLCSPKVEWKWLMPRVELGINIILSLLQKTIFHIKSYQKNKIVKARVQGAIPVDTELITQPGIGLTGFCTPPKQNM